MKPVNIGGHPAYQNRVLTQLRKYYPNAATSLPDSTWQILEKFWSLDLSPVDTLMQDRYSVFGPEPRLPSDMLRALLVSVEFKITSYTRFAADLKENHLHAIISGFSVGDTPGTGTFYDFHSRLWLSDIKNLSEALHPPKEKPQKPKGKEEKAAPVEKVTVDDLFRQFEENPPSDMAPCLRLWEIFNTFFLQSSVDKDLISLKELALAGDGTPAYTSAQERKTRTCDCLERESGIANAIAFITSPIVTSAGAPTATAFTLVMTCICLPHRTLRMTFLFFLFWGLPHGMIHMDFYTTGFL